MAGQRRIPRGRLARLSRIAKLGSRLGATLAGSAGRLAIGSDRAEVASRFHAGAARALRDELGRMKGLPMKAGQVLSFAAHLIPREHRAAYEETLRELQVLSNPMRSSVVERVLRDDLGGTPEELFASFDREPIAAASIGQVHRATLHDGRRVAVKVQYPGIADAIRSDLKNVDLIRSALSILLPKVEVEQTLEEIATRMLEECDYGCELCNQQEFAAIWRGDPDVWIPPVVEELSGEHILVTELADGDGWQAMLERADPAERSRLGRILFRFVFRSFYVFALTNADPHPGNYVFLPDGRIAFLDFGCVQRFDLETVRGSARLRQALVGGERGDAVRDMAVQVWGLPEEIVDAEVWGAIQEYMVATFQPVLETPFRFSDDLMERQADLILKVKLILARKALRRGVQEATTPGLTFLSRTTVGLCSLLAALEAEGDWAEEMARIDAELEARWSAAEVA